MLLHTTLYSTIPHYPLIATLIDLHLQIVSCIPHLYTTLHNTIPFYPLIATLIDCFFRWRRCFPRQETAEASVTNFNQLQVEVMQNI